MDENMKWFFEDLLRSARFQQPKGFIDNYRDIEGSHKKVRGFLSSLRRGDLGNVSFPDVVRRDEELLMEFKDLENDIRVWLEENFFVLLTSRYMDYLRSLQGSAKT